MNGPTYATHATRQNGLMNAAHNRQQKRIISIMRRRITGQTPPCEMHSHGGANKIQTPPYHPAARCSIATQISKSTCFEYGTTQIVTRTRRTGFEIAKNDQIRTRNTCKTGLYTLEHCQNHP